MSILESTPRFSLEQAADYVCDLYGLSLTHTKSLPSERDQNFLFTDTHGDRFVLKISGAAEDRAFLAAQNSMMQHVGRCVEVCPKVVPAVNGQSIAEVSSSDSQTHLVRLVTFLDGDPMAAVRYHPPELLHDLGRCVGQMDAALVDFDHDALHRQFHWDLAEASDIVSTRIDSIVDDEQRRFIEYFREQFEKHTSPLLDQLPKSVIHSDANDGNVIVQQAALGVPATNIVGLIDFGDAVYSWTVGDLAIAVAYAILGKPDPLSVAIEIVRGYHAERPLSEEECAAIHGLVCMRLSVSAVIGADQQRARPDDPYLGISQAPIRETMPRLARIPYGFATAALRSARGLPPVKKHDDVCKWLDTHRDTFVFPIQCHSKHTQLTVLDLGVESALLPGGENALCEQTLTRVVQNELTAHDATIGVGRYLEPRLLYTTEQFIDGDSWQEERRTVHLGIDLFASAGSEVQAPLDGTVHIVCEIRKPLDYGTLVILRHETDDGDCFFTLYGHLARRTQNHLRVGQSVSKRETFAWLGDATENGGWTPHLHFQVILDLIELGHQFPGVGQASQSEVWSALSPDPNRILQIPAELFPATSPCKSDTLIARREGIGRNLSIGYDNPVKIVRGWMQYLYDDTGRRYIDAYNNVPHVGHCHPEIVEAARRQSQLLNTNTRYLSDLLTEYSARVAATMPDPLNVCYFVNSASEANELALRLARAYTGQRDMIVLEGAYHGNTTTLIDISPYKHNGPGGLGSPEWVHVAPIADIYRGKYRDQETAGREYADGVGVIVEKLNSRGRGVCGFIAESCPSVGGQILFPREYLTAVYECVRSAGGVCIADDVQTGYGRLGKAFYGFELQQVVPDIVVLGKPIGNGHPIAAVVTTPAIADAFDTGMEFFSTFGGNTVSCAVGLAVLDVVQRENLQAHALKLGAHLLRQFSRLKDRFDIIGDVRGAGLFLGIELVRDHQSLEPATVEASFVSNRMRDRGILLGVDGPAHNVIKIRPPMPFSFVDADILIEMLIETFAEL